MRTVFLALSLAAMVAIPTIARAAAPQLREQAPSFYRMMLGDFEITALSDGTVMQPVDKTLLRISPDELARLAARNFRSIPAETSINAYLINTGKELVLVDTGAGSWFGGRGGGRLLSSLRASGYRPEQVDSVLITHMHGDHLAGLVTDGKPVFPNAVVRAAPSEIDFWSNPANEANVPVAWREWFREALGILKLYAGAARVAPIGDGGSVYPGITAQQTFGHTPGHCFYVIESGGQKLVIVGDVAHMAEVQFTHPETPVIFDLDPDAAIGQRKAFLADAASGGYLVAGAHLPFPGIGHIRKGERGAYDWVPSVFSIIGLK